MPEHSLTLQKTSVEIPIGDARSLLAGRNVLAVEVHQSSSPDAEGACSLNRVNRVPAAERAAHFVLKAKLDDLESEEVKLEPGQGELNFDLLDRSSISGQVVAMDGRPLPSVLVDPNEQAAAKPSASKRAPASTGPVVLVIDDDPDMRELTTRSLGKEGYRVECAANGEEGLAMARELRPAVITLDVMMPGLDGWAVLTALKEGPATTDIPVIMITAKDPTAEDRARLNGEICRILRKSSFSPESPLTEIRELVSTQGEFNI